MDYVCSDNDSSDVKLSEEGAQQEDKVHKVTGEEVKSERSPTYDGVQGNTWDGSDPFPGEDNQPYQPQWGAEDETSSDGVTMATDNDASDTFVNQDREQYWQKPTEYQDEFVLILNTDSKPKGCPVETIMQSYGMYKVIWNGHHDELQNILNWFRFELKPGDENSVIEFPPTLPKEERQTIHILLHSLKLGGHSYFNGVNNQKVLKVYTSDLVCKRKLQKLKKKTFKNNAVKLMEWLQAKHDGRIPGGYNLRDITEMLAFKQMANEQLQQLYDEFQQRNTRHSERLETKPKQTTSYLETETRQTTSYLETETRQPYTKAATRVWIEPEDGKMGHFFFNKLQFQDGSYWDYQNIGATQILTFSDLVPVDGLQSVFITHDAWFSDPSFVTGYFPSSVIVSIVCPKRHHQKGVCNYQLLDCISHRKEVIGYETESGELVDVKCECPNKSVIEIIQPDFSHKMNAKLMIMRYQTYARIVVSSVSLDQTSWRTVGHYGWYCDLPMDSQQRNMHPAPSGSFGDTLARFLEEITVKPASVLRGIGFSELSPTVKLVMSVPARNCQRDIFRHGMHSIGHQISGLSWPSAEPNLIYQTPVVDFENRAYSFIALLGKLSSLNQASLSGTERKDYESQLKLNEMKIVYPSNVQETSAFVFQNGFEKMSYCDSKFYTRQYMFHNEDPVFGKVAWNSRIMSRFCEVSDVNPKTQAARKFGWLFVGSFDLSCNSWGEVSVKDRGVCIWSYQSYELGVLHIPQKVNTPEGPQLWSPDFSTIVLPYNETTLVKYPQYAYPIMQRPDSHHPQLVGRLFFKGSTVFIQDTFPRNKQEEDFIGDPQLNKNNWNAARASCYHDTPARLRQTTINKCPGFVPEIGSLIVFHVSPPSMNPFQSGRRSKSQQGLNVLWICDYMYPERHEKTEMENGESKDDLCMNFLQLPLSDGPNGADAPTEIPKQTNQPTMVRYTGMKVIGLEADPYTLTISSPGAFEVKRPERRDVFLKKMLYNIHGVDVTKPSVQAQRRLRRARALLVSTKKKMLDVKTAGGLDRKN